MPSVAPSLNRQRLWQRKGRAVRCRGCSSRAKDCGVCCYGSWPPPTFRGLWRKSPRSVENWEQNKTTGRSGSCLTGLNLKGKSTSRDEKNPSRSLFPGLRHDTRAAAGLQQRKVSSVLSQTFFNMKQFHYLHERYIASHDISSSCISLSLKETHSRENSVSN